MAKELCSGDILGHIGCPVQPPGSGEGEAAAAAAVFVGPLVLQQSAD